MSDGYHTYTLAWYHIAKAWKVSTTYVQDFFAPQEKLLEKKISQLKDELMKLHLMPTMVDRRYRYTCQSTTTKSALHNILQAYGPKHTKAGRESDAIEFLARSIFTQWLVQQLHGRELYNDEEGNVRRV